MKPEGLSSNQCVKGKRELKEKVLVMARQGDLKCLALVVEKKKPGNEGSRHLLFWFRGKGSKVRGGQECQFTNPP